MEPADRLRRLVLLAVLALVATVSLVRGVDLARHGWHPTAPGETRWMEWTVGNPWERAVRAAVREEAVPTGEREIEVQIEAGGPVRADWVQVMTQYDRPALRVLAVEVEGQGRSGPVASQLAERTVLRIAVSEPPASDPAGQAISVRAGSARLRVLFYGLLLLLVAGGVLTRATSAWERVHTLSWLVLAVALALFGWKVIEAPLWSWDHHAIWGLKIRRLVTAGLFPGWLAPPAFPYSAPQYPLGWPLLVAPLAALTSTSAALFKAVHVLCGAALALLVRFVVRRGGGDRLAATTAASLTAVSPLFWDTESLGLADLPLTLCAVTALSVFLAARQPERSASRLLLVLAGLVVGFLPWMKDEGWSLSVALLGAASLLGFARLRRRLLALLLPAVTLWILYFPFHATFTSPGTGFFAGDWPGRVRERIFDLPEILGRIALVLLDPAWLGVWILFGAALAWAILRRGVRRHRPAIFVAGVVLAQLGVYAFVYLATYLDPAAHIASSFFRIAAALAPLAVIASGIASTGLLPDSPLGVADDGDVVQVDGPCLDRFRPI